MASNIPFTPRWASPPGDTVRDILDERGLTKKELASTIKLSEEAVDALLESSVPMSIEIARRLADSIGASVEFWVTRDSQYRDDLLRVQEDDWLRALPIRQMSSFGWIQPPSDWGGTLEECLRFFEVPDVQAWKVKYEPLIRTAMLRSPNTMKVQPLALAAWMRQGEIQTAGLKTESWNPTEFRKCLLEVRRLTRQKDPAKFLSPLASICSAAGVAVATVRPPKGSPVSGVARFVRDDRGLVLLSGRYLSDDHFWFTFFHEAAHLLLHDATKTYIDELDPKDKRPRDSQEAQADEFAQEMLVPATFLESLSKERLTVRRLVGAARKVGVSPGIVVGQLQHAGYVGYDKLNSLKRRYRWRGTNLERV